jgi:multidrug resistance protein, MATE family
LRPMRSLGPEFRTQLKLAGPVVLAQLGMMAMGTVDQIMVGHLDGEEVAKAALAAVGLGNLLYMFLAVFASATVMAVDPIVSQALGARDSEAVALGIQRGVVLALLFGLLFALPLLLAGPILARLDQPPAVVPDATLYARWMVPSLPIFLLFGLLRQVLVALHLTRPILIAVGIANLINVAADWILIHGNLGAPRLEVLGSALATLFSRGAMIGLLLLFAWSELRPHLLPLQLRAATRARPLLKLLRIGAPIGVQSMLEMLAFGLIVPLMGWLGALQQAGHMVAINLASLSFMVPLGISAAASVRAGHHVGAGDADAVRRSAAVSLVLGTSVMLFSAALFLTLPRLLASIYTEDAEVIAMAVLLLPLAGLFQLFDGLQVVALGVLRGVGDTFVPMLIALVGYWGVGFPFGYWLAFERGVGARGLWWGLVAGLGVVSAVLLVRVRVRLGRELARL